MNCVLMLPLTSRKLSLGCISFVFRYLLVSQNTKKKMSAWPWQHFLKFYHVALNLMIDFQSILFASLTVFSDLSLWKHARPPSSFSVGNITLSSCVNGLEVLHWHFFLLLPWSCLYCLRVILCTFLCPFFSKLFSSDPRVQYQSRPRPQILH